MIGVLITRGNLNIAHTHMWRESMWRATGRRQPRRESQHRFFPAALRRNQPCRHFHLTLPSHQNYETKVFCCWFMQFLVLCQSISGNIIRWPCLEIGALQMYLRWHHTGLGWAINPMTGVLRRKSCEDTEAWETRREESPVTTEVESEAVWLPGKGSQEPLATTRSWERGRAFLLLQRLQKEPPLPAPWFWSTSPPQNCERINPYLFKPNSSCQFVMAALAKQYRKHCLKFSVYW